jgi:hypothetical protein
MFFDKCRRALLYASVLGLFGAAATGNRALLARDPQEPTKAVAPQQPEKKPESGPARLQNLLTERLAAAKAEYQAAEEQLVAGRMPVGNVFDASQHLLRSELELATSKERRVAIREEHAARMKKILDSVWARYTVGRASIYEHTASRYHYAEACIEVERERTR